MTTKILVLASNPNETERLQLNPEIRSIRDSHERSRLRDQFSLAFEPSIRISELQRIVMRENPRIVHFCGHGTGHQGLILENNEGQLQLVSTEALTNLLKIFNYRIECVVLNACHTSVQGQRIQQHINFLVATQREIRDDAALLFTKGFYDALFDGQTYRDAYELGCNRIHLELYKDDNLERKLIPVYSEIQDNYIDLAQHEILLFLEKEPPNLIVAHEDENILKPNLLQKITDKISEYPKPFLFINALLICGICILTVSFLRNIEIKEAKAWTNLSNELLKSDKDFDALIAGIKGVKKTQSWLHAYCNFNFLNICPQREKLNRQIKSNLLQLLGNVDQVNRLEGHTNWVYAVDFCQRQSGEKLENAIATASADKTFKLWKESESQIYEEIKLDIPQGKSHTDWIYDIAFGSGCRKIATAGKDGSVLIWDWNWNSGGEDLNLTNDELFKHSDRVSAVSFAKDATLASSSWDDTVKFWNISNSTEKHKEIDLDHKDDVLNVSYSLDGKKIATASADKTIKIWDKQAKQVKKIDNAHTDKISSVSFSQDNQIIASGSWDWTIKFWNVSDGKLSETLEGHTDRVFDVSFIPAQGEEMEEILATAGWDGTVKIWNRQGTLLRTLTGHTDRVLNVSFSKDGKTLASSGADNNVILWKINNNWQPILRGHEDDIRKVEFSPDGEKIGTASLDGTVKIWNTKDGTDDETLPKFTDRENDLYDLYSVSFKSDRIVAIAGESDEIKLYNLEDKEDSLQQPITINSEQGLIFDIDFSQDGRWMASSGADKTAHIWKINDKNQPEEFCILSDENIEKNHTDRVVDVEFLSNKNKLLTASDDNTAKLWRFDPENSDPNKKCKLEKTLNFIEENGNTKGHQDEVNGVSFISDGKCEMIATSSDDKTIKLWDLDGNEILPKGVQEKERLELEGHKERVMSVEFASKLNKKEKEETVYLASASFDKTVKLWKIDCNSEAQEPQNIQMSLLRTFRGHKDWVWDASFNHDGTKLASASRDKTVRLWSLKDINLNKANDLANLADEGCEQIESYFKTNPKTEDPNMCD